MTTRPAADGRTSRPSAAATMPSLAPRPVGAHPTDDMIRVVFDLDGTLADYVGGLRRFLAAEQGLTPAEALDRYPPTTNYDFGEWGIPDREAFVDLHSRAVTQGRLYLTLDALPAATRAAHAFSRAGMWNVVLTHRFHVHGTMSQTVKDTVDWLDIARDPSDPTAPTGIPYRDLLVTGRKSAVAGGAALVFEDAPENIAALEAAGYTVITLAQPYNVGVGKVRVDGWDDAVDVASELLDVDVSVHYRAVQP